MLYKRKGSQFWWVKISIGGRRIRRSTKTANRPKAIAFAARLKDQEWSAQYAGARTWEEAVTRWLDEREHKRSIDRDRAILLWLNTPERLRDKYLHEINRDLLHELHKAKADETSRSTANRCMALVRAILNAACREWDWLPKVPRVPFYKLDTPDYRWLTREEFAALVTELPTHTQAIARFAVATGLRRTNITHLRWSQVNLSKAEATIAAGETKGKRGLSIPLNADALAVLRNQKRLPAKKRSKVWVFPYHGQPVYQVTTRAWREAVKKLKRPGFRFHDLRHTWASWHVQAGTPLHAVQALGGWASPTLVSRYGHHDASSLQGYAAAVPLQGATVTKSKARARKAK